MTRRQEADRTRYTFGKPEPKQLNRESLTQIRQAFSHGSAWIVVGLIAILIGGLGWYTESPRGDATTEGRVVNVERTITDVVQNGNVRQENEEVATIEYVDTSGVTRTITSSSRGLDEGDTPTIAFDPDDPTNGRVLGPLRAKIAIGIGGLGAPIILFGVVKLFRRRAT